MIRFRRTAVPFTSRTDACRLASMRIISTPVMTLFMEAAI